MTEYFRIIYSSEVETFMDSIEKKARQKIIYNIDKARQTMDAELLSKLDKDIWEFRTLFNRKKYRILAFWDRRKSEDTLVIATNGFIKKTQKTPRKEIEKARRIMENYFKNT